MANKTIQFSVNQLIVNMKTFTINTFDEISVEDLDKLQIKHKDDRGEEVLMIKKITKTILVDRFIGIYFLEGDKYPYSDTVVDANLEEHKNPRGSNEIELDKQYFVLIDTKTQRIFLSDLKKKNLTKKWFEDKLKMDIDIKSIINEEDFINKIQSVNQISFTLVPNLFNSADESVLSKKLLEDIYGFGASKAKLDLFYNNSSVSDTIKEKFKSLIGRKDEFESITVIGRSDENFESVFNLGEIINKINVDVNEDGETQFVDPIEVFNRLIELIK